MNQQIGRTPIPVELLNERRQFEVTLRLAGITIETIVRQTNNQTPIKGWGTVTYRTVSRDIAAYFRENKSLSYEDYDHAEQMRRAHIAAMEQTMEKLSLHIQTKKTWEPFEYPRALETLHKMQAAIAEIENWNLGTKNPDVKMDGYSSDLQDIHDAARSEIRRMPEDQKQTVLDLLNDSISKLKEEPKSIEELEKEVENLQP